MQPARDPNDLRYVSARRGGTGQGFTQHGKAHSPYRYGAISRRGTLTKLASNPDTSSMDSTTGRVTRQAVRERARIVALKLLDRIDANAPSMDGDQVATALREAGRLADVGRVQGQGAGQVINIGTLHLDALRARASARIANDPNALRALQSSDATVIDHDTSGDVSADNTTG